MYVISELPVKQGVLFSEDEVMDVDAQKLSGLTALPKITLFEVEINIWCIFLSAF